MDMNGMLLDNEKYRQVGLAEASYGEGEPRRASLREGKAVALARDTPPFRQKQREDGAPGRDVVVPGLLAFEEGGGF